MLKMLREIEQEYNIPINTLRSAIHRGLIEAAKVGGIIRLSDESPRFKEYVAEYKSRSIKESSVSIANDHEGTVEKMDTIQRRGITIGLCNQKGGVGKSSTVASLASIYASWGLKVLVIDSDPQGNASLQLGVDCLSEGEEVRSCPAANLYMERAAAHELAISTQFEGLFLVPAAVDLAEVEMNLPGLTGSDLRLRMSLRQARKHFDLIILDSPPNLGKFSVNVLIASDWFLVPVAGAWALRSVKALLSVAQRNADYYSSNNQFLGLFLTMTDRTKIIQNVREVAHSKYPGHVLNSEIRRSTLAREAEAMGIPLPIYSADSTLAEDFQALALEIAGKIGLTKPAKPSLERALTH